MPRGAVEGCRDRLGSPGSLCWAGCVRKRDGRSCRLELLAPFVSLLWEICDPASLMDALERSWCEHVCFSRWPSPAREQGRLLHPRAHRPGRRARVLTLRRVSAVEHVCAGAGTSLLAAYEQWRGSGDSQACCDYSLHVDVPRWHESLKEELEVLVKDKGKGRAGGVLAVTPRNNPHAVAVGCRHIGTSPCGER